MNKPDYPKIVSDFIEEVKSSIAVGTESPVEIDVLEFLDKYNHHDLISVYQTDYAKFEKVINLVRPYLMNLSYKERHKGNRRISLIFSGITFHFCDDGRLSSITITPTEALWSYKFRAKDLNSDEFILVSMFPLIFTKVTHEE